MAMDALVVDDGPRAGEHPRWRCAGAPAVPLACAPCPDDPGPEVRGHDVATEREPPPTPGTGATFADHLGAASALGVVAAHASLIVVALVATIMGSRES